MLLIYRPAEGIVQVCYCAVPCFLSLIFLIFLNLKLERMSAETALGRRYGLRTFGLALTQDDNMAHLVDTASGRHPAAARKSPLRRAPKVEAQAPSPGGSRGAGESRPETKSKADSADAGNVARTAEATARIAEKKRSAAPPQVLKRKRGSPCPRRGKPGTRTSAALAAQTRTWQTSRPPSPNLPFRASHRQARASPCVPTTYPPPPSRTFATLVTFTSSKAPASTPRKRSLGATYFSSRERFSDRSWLSRRRTQQRQGASRTLRSS